MRVVVTGALGHIGSRLIRDLPDAWPGAEIVMLDNLATERYASLFDLPAAGRYRVRRRRTCSRPISPAMFAGADAVIHLAALTNWARTDLRDRMQRVNVDGTERVARACVAARRRRCCFRRRPASTACRTASSTKTVAAPDLQPQSPYAAWKLQSEELLATRWASTTGLQFVIFRMGTIFGPSDRDAVSHRREPVLLAGGGAVSRSRSGKPPRTSFVPISTCRMRCAR